jgi:cell wall-associated NlpC family hydrolase
MQRLLLVVFVVALALPAFSQEQEEPKGIIERARSWIGVRYRFGGSDEKRGFDCAGFVRRVFGTVGIELPRSAATQYRHGCIVEKDELEPGDLVFFRNTYKRGISHVGIYLGERKFIHAASRRRSVSIDSLDSPYYLARFAGARRIAPPRS